MLATLGNKQGSSNSLRKLLSKDQDRINIEKLMDNPSVLTKETETEESYSENSRKDDEEKDEEECEVESTSSSDYNYSESSSEFDSSFDSFDSEETSDSDEYTEDYTYTSEYTDVYTEVEEDVTVDEDDDDDGSSYSEDSEPTITTGTAAHREAHRSPQKGSRGKAPTRSQSYKGISTPPTRNLPVRIASSEKLNMRPHALTSKHGTLVGWIVELLKQHLQRIVAYNLMLDDAATAIISSTQEKDGKKEESTSSSSGQQPGEVDTEKPQRRLSVLEQISEVIQFPSNINQLDNEALALIQLEAHERVQLPDEVSSQLHELVKEIASLYNAENPFHNFEHACNVTLAAAKFLHRMVTEQDPLTEEDRTFGIAKDPFTQFAIVLGALFHDTDHEGVPNAQLEKDRPEKAQAYYGRSIAEQHSICAAWHLFMQPRFVDLRNTICNNSKAELHRLYKLIVNIVMATDIADKQLKEFRTARFVKAFETDNSKEGESSPTSFQETCDLKATVGIEHLIQISDVAHTMQPWRIYRQWNAKLFAEMSKAYKEGRAEKNPAEFWYKGEIGFYDFYVIPLAQKLQKCQMFGSLADECLDFAQRNRKAWVEMGHAAVRAMTIEHMEDDDLLAILDKVMDDCDGFME